MRVFSKINFEEDVIRTQVLTQSIVIANSPEYVKSAFVTSHQHLESKSHLMKKALKPIVSDGLFISDGTLWANRRKPVGAAIHGSKLPYYYNGMVDSISELQLLWSKQPDGQRIDMLSEMTKLTAKVIARTIFGSHISQADLHEIASGFSDYQNKIGVFNILPLLGLPDKETYLFTRGIMRSAQRVRSVINRLTDLALKEDSTSFLKLLSIDKHSTNSLSRDALRNEAAVILMAGHETTANTLSWVWYILSQDKATRDRLYSEVDTVLCGNAPCLDNIKKLVFTKAVIEETLRLYPPVPILSRQATQDIAYKEISIKKGSLVAVVPWLLHRHKHYWHKPDAFIADLFINPAMQPKKYTYVPFSVGPRVCAGMAFGLTESILAVSLLAQKFDFKLQPSTTIEAVSHLSLRPDDGKGLLPMTVHLRNTAPLKKLAQPAYKNHCPHIKQEELHL